MKNRKLSKEEIRQRQRTKSGFLVEQEVARIKWLGLVKGETPRALSAAFMVSRATIWSILRGDTWGWVEPSMDTASVVPEALSPEMAKAAEESLRRFQATYGLAQPQMAEVVQNELEPPPALERLLREVNEAPASAERLLDELAQGAKGDSK